MGLFGRSRRGTRVTMTPRDLGNRPPMAFATQLIRGSCSQARRADGGVRQDNGYPGMGVHHHASRVECTGIG